MYEDEFELTFQVPEEESAPEPLAAPAAKPAAPVEPVVDEPTRIMTLEKTAAPVAEEPTRVITLEKPAEPQPPAPPQPEEPAPQPVKERPAPAAPAAARRVLISGGDRGIGAAAARAFAAAGYQVAIKKRVRHNTELVSLCMQFILTNFSQPIKFHCSDSTFFCQCCSFCSNL